MTEFAILVAAVCLLAIVIDHFRAVDISAQMVYLFRRGDQIDILGNRYKVVGSYFDRDVLRVRRTLRG